jgi:hypothetical protein
MYTDLVAWENGEMSEVDEIQFFSNLITTGMAWSLQGCYGRAAMYFIENNIISQKGKILVNLNEIYE